MLKILRLLIVLAVLPIANAASAQNYKITHAGLKTLYLAPLFIAMDRGMFKARGLEVKYEEIDSGALSTAALLSGAANMTSDDLMGIAPLAKQGKEFMMIYNLLDRMTMDFVVRKEFIEKSGIDPKSDVMSRIKMLKGMTIGITRPAAPTDVYARFLMKEAGLNPDRDATLVQIGGVAALSAAFRSGKIDGFMLSPPLPQSLEKEGFGSIIVHNTGAELGSLADITYIAMFTTKDFATKNPQAVKAYADGIAEAVVWLKANPDEAIKMMGATWFKDTSADAMRISMDRLLPAISSNGVFTKEGLLKVKRIYENVGEKMDINFDEGSFWTNQFVKK